MKILYLSCHIVLEFDEFRILNQLGERRANDLSPIGKVKIQKFGEEKNGNRWERLNLFTHTCQC